MKDTGADDVSYETCQGRKEQKKDDRDVGSSAHISSCKWYALRTAVVSGRLLGWMLAAAEG
jgi:hypothetical protein